MDEDLYNDWYFENKPELITDFIFEHESGKQYLYEYVESEKNEPLDKYLEKSTTFNDWCDNEYINKCVCMAEYLTEMREDR